MSLDKYDRLKRIPNWKQETLANAKVAVFGCGALGNEVLKNLALLGVGHIWVIDYDTIEIHNLTRSVLFREADVGRHKAEAVAERVKELNPDTQVYPIIGKLEYAFGRGLLREMNVAFGCLDSVGARREINKRCYFAGVPWVDGGINHQLGNVAVFDPRVPEAACYRCQMDSSAWERLNERFSCGYLKDDFKDSIMATTIMTSAVVAAYQVEAAVQLLLWEESHLKSGTSLLLPVSHPIGFRVVKFTLDPECPDHASIPKVGQTHALPVKFERTPKQVAQELDLCDDWQLELPFDFVSKFVCQNCGYVEPVKKPVKEVKQGATKCPQCDNLNREAVKYFRLTADSEDADLSFKDFSLVDRELLSYINSEKQKIHIEIIQDFQATKINQ
ncbi:ThiF family adenylyltransferase [Geitlerinema sp. P-1104]|uniref:HesA/MoeB/ThiF family protein n=1 Tax=Geitlerinema sp. P-1104 TaxID=2546230 RepID=UPI001476B4B5|nr:ThiF family adenylyltransferase [Geitlerinema sp. P-1104]NMG60032.1 ThiF family adenylyltransferase [Geitlerinema sp. P-1104]